MVRRSVGLQIWRAGNMILGHTFIIDSSASHITPMLGDSFAVAGKRLFLVTSPPEGEGEVL